MADDVSQRIEDALNEIVNTTDKSENIKKELNKSIHEAVSNTRNLIFILKHNLLERTEENNHMRNEVKQLKDTLEAWKSGFSKTSGAICYQLLRINQQWNGGLHATYWQQ